MFESIYSYNPDGTLTLTSGLIAVAASLVLGIVISLAFRFRSESGRSLSAALVALPVIVQLVILMVNGDAGTGVAVLGAFSLIRFRSVPGTARDIVFIFLSMAAGIATGVGRVYFAAFITAVVCLVMVVLSLLGYGMHGSEERDLRITIPEELDYTTVFDDLFAKYTKKSELLRVKTTNMGSLYELRYRITLRPGKNEKAFLDELRCRNGNLTIVFSRSQAVNEEMSL